LALREIPRPDGAALAYQLYGMKVEPLDGEIARQLGIPQNIGLLVRSVDRHSPADRSGVRPGDLLVQLGRLRVRDLDAAGLELEGVKPDEAKYIRVLRFSRHGDVYAIERYIYAR
jgi:S1-C subfamily serine protease